MFASSKTFRFIAYLFASAILGLILGANADLSCNVYNPDFKSCSSFVIPGAEACVTYQFTDPNGTNTRDMTAVANTTLATMKANPDQFRKLEACFTDNCISCRLPRIVGNAGTYARAEPVLLITLAVVTMLAYVQ